MRNFLLTLMFDGSAYHGWQVQSNAVTVQETLQDALERILGTRYPVTGCSRTDSGVHALEFCCNVRAETALCPERLSAALNAVLPRDIAVRSLWVFTRAMIASAKHISISFGTERRAIPFTSGAHTFIPMCWMRLF